jgi:hypothetical protein
VDNEAVWQAAQRFDAGADRSQLDRELTGAFTIGFNAGHWQGQGEPTGAEHPGPGGSLDDLMDAIEMYHDGGKTEFRSKFEQLVSRIADLNPPLINIAIEPSTNMRSTTEFVELRITRVQDAAYWDEIGIDPGPDEADFYARASIADQAFVSRMIHGYDTFDFALPNYPFTFIKAVPPNWRTAEPVTTMRVTITTADSSGAGTNDDVFLELGYGLRYKLDKSSYDDFEAGDQDTYSIDFGRGLLVRDIQYIKLKKSADGIDDGWKLNGIAFWVNDRQVYAEDGMAVWLEDDYRSWRAAGFVPTAPVVDEIPVTLQLYDSDGGWYGEDEPCDINPDVGRYDLNLLYDRNSGRYRGDLQGIVNGTSLGGTQYGGRLDSDSDRSQIEFAIETYNVTSPVPGIFVDLRNDAFEDGSQAQPFNTVAEGVAAATGQRDNIMVAPGSYAERLVIDKPCTLKVWGSGAVVIGQ